MNIGFFDSGLGGLTILREVVKVLPQYDYVYFGDTANLPYGDKTEEEIYALTKAGVTKLFEQDCLLVVVACNTASSESIRRLQDTFLLEEYPDRKILGVIVPTVEELLETDSKAAMLLATQRTVHSGKYEKEIKNRATREVTLHSVPMSKLVPLIESGNVEAAGHLAVAAIESEAGESDTVVLGCTHYTLLKVQLREYFADKIKILSQDEIIPKKLARYLSRHPELTEKLTSTGKRSIQLSEHRPDYDRLTATFLGGAYLPHDE